MESPRSRVLHDQALEGKSFSEVGAAMRSRPKTRRKGLNRKFRRISSMAKSVLLLHDSSTVFYGHFMAYSCHFTF